MLPEPLTLKNGGAGQRETGAATEAPFVEGQRVGPYVLLEWVGAGGMGVVYGAYDTELDRKVAIKLLATDPSNESSTEAGERLTREAKALARISHPNVVRVFKVDTFEGHVCLAMEYVEGGTLAHWLAKKPRSWRAILDMCIGAGRGLSAVHAAGLVHRDFKPANVLVGTDDWARVGDFGLARPMPTPPDVATSAPTPNAPSPLPRAADASLPLSTRAASERTTMSAVSGTPKYMAPEQYDRAATAKSDQYAYCAVLYEALYGEPPFDSPGPALGRPRAAPRATSVPSWLRSAVLRGLRRNPEERYPSMAALLDALSADPNKIWQRRGLMVTALSALTVAGAVYLHATHRSAETCQGGENQLLGLWDGPRQEAIARTFLSTEKPYAADSWRSAKQTLDDYAHAWVAMRSGACQAAQRGEESAGLLDRQMACFGERLKALDALADVFARADATVVKNAPMAAEKLPPLTECRDSKFLLQRATKPTDEATATKAEALRGQLAQVKAMEDAGHYGDVVPFATGLVATARALAYPPIEGEALFRLGRLQVLSGNGAEGQQTLLDAARMADTSGDDRTRARVWATLLSFASIHRLNSELAPFFQTAATGALERAGGDKESQAEVEAAIGNKLYSEGKFGEARASIERALALRKKLDGPDSVDVARLLMNTANSYQQEGRFDEALAGYEAALKLYEKVVGPSHEAVGHVEDNIALLFYRTLRFDEAKRHWARAVQVTEAALGPDHPFLAYVLDGFGEGLAELGQYADATTAHRRSLAILDKAGVAPNDPWRLITLKGLGIDLVATKDYERAIPCLEQAKNLDLPEDETDTAEAKFGLAMALVEGKNDLPRARELALQARDAYQKSGSGPRDTRNLARIRAWLDRYGLPPTKTLAE